jgi:HEAT repeat protein
MVVPNPHPDDYDSFVEHLGVEHRWRPASRHLIDAGNAALPAVRRGLRSTNPAVRVRCVNVLDHIADESSFEDLVDLLDDHDPDVVARALHALACDKCKEGACRPGEGLFVPKAIELLQTHPVADVRFHALDALGKVAPRRPEVVAVLEQVAERAHKPSARKAAKLRCPGGAIYEREHRATQARARTVQ